MADSAGSDSDFESPTITSTQVTRVSPGKTTKSNFMNKMTMGQKGNNTGAINMLLKKKALLESMAQKGKSILKESKVEPVAKPAKLPKLGQYDDESSGSSTVVNSGKSANKAQKKEKISSSEDSESESDDEKDKGRKTAAKKDSSDEEADSENDKVDKSSSDSDSSTQRKKKLTKVKNKSSKALSSGDKTDSSDDDDSDSSNGSTKKKKVHVTKKAATSSSEESDNKDKNTKSTTKIKILSNTIVKTSPMVERQNDVKADGKADAKSMKEKDDSGSSSDDSSKSGSETDSKVKTNGASDSDSSADWDADKNELTRIKKDIGSDKTPKNVHSDSSSASSSSNSSDSSSDASSSSSSDADSDSGDQRQSQSEKKSHKILQDYVALNHLQETRIKTKFDIVNDITSDDEVFLVKISKQIDPNLLLNKKIRLNKPQTLQLKGEKFTMNFNKADTQDLCILGPNRSAKDKNREMTMRQIHTNGSIMINQNFKVDDVQPFALDTSASKQKVPFPTQLKERHPFFGSKYQSRIELDEKTKKKLESYVVDFIKKENKKKKKDKSKKKIIDATDATIDHNNIEKSIENVKKKKKVKDEQMDIASILSSFSAVADQTDGKEGRNEKKKVKSFNKDEQIESVSKKTKEKELKSPKVLEIINASQESGKKKKKKDKSFNKDDSIDGANKKVEETETKSPKVLKTINVSQESGKKKKDKTKIKEIVNGKREKSPVKNVNIAMKMNNSKEKKKKKESELEGTFKPPKDGFKSPPLKITNKQLSNIINSTMNSPSLGKAIFDPDESTIEPPNKKKKKIKDKDKSKDTSGKEDAEGSRKRRHSATVAAVPTKSPVKEKEKATGKIKKRRPTMA